jgi:O-antigen/teichoic acid export membrane protein
MLAQGLSSKLTELSGALRRSPFLRASLLGIFARLSTVVTRLATVPAMLYLLGTESFGILSVVTSTVYWLAIADLGIPASLQNPLSAAIQTQDHTRAEHLFLSAFFKMAKTGLWVFAIGLFAMNTLNLTELLKIQGGRSSEFIVLYFCCLTTFSLFYFCRLGTPLAYATGHPSLPPIAELSGNFFSLLVASVALLLDIRSLTLLGISIIACNLLPSVLTFFAILRLSGFRIKRLKDSFGNKGHSKRAPKSFFYFINTLAESTMFGGIQLAISAGGGPTAVTAYNVPMTLFNLFLTLQGAVMRPLWPKLHATPVDTSKNSVSNIAKTAIKWLCPLSLAFSAVAIVFGPFALSLWTSNRVTPSLQMMISISILTVISTFDYLLATVAFAKELIRPRAICFLTAMLAACATTFYLARADNLDLVPAVTGLAILLFATLPTAIFTWHILSPSKEK